MKKFFFALLLFSVMIFHARSVYAEANQGGLTLSPMFQEIALKQTDQQKFFSVSLTNNTDAILTLHLSLLDFRSLDESGGVAFLGASNDLEKKYALSSWMRPEKDTVILQPGESQNVKVTIENRDSLAPGGHYGAVVFKAGDDADDPSATNRVAVNQLFSMLVFVKKIGGEIYSLDLKGEEYKQNIFAFPKMLELRFGNSGNVHIVPRGTVTITDPLKRVVSKGIINEESGLILPESIRVYPARLNQLAFSFVPGRYTMKIDYRYDGREDFTTVTRQFNFIPPMTIAAILALAVMGGWFAMRRRRQNRDKSPRESI